MRRSLLALALAALAAGGCGGAAPATVKGRIVSNGEPMAVAGPAAITFTQLDGEAKMFTAMLKPDGTFEVVASGGQLPPGNYRVSLMAVGKAGDKFKAFGDTNSPIRRELKPGANEVTVDVSKPEG